MEWKTKLSAKFSGIQFLQNEPMSRHTTFKIGGPAEVYVEPGISEAVELISYCRKDHIPYTILGNGSNVLVSDAGLQGVVISFGKAASHIAVEGNRITAQAGALLSQVANAAAKANLTGLEFAAGIPGTVGGAMMMNAGAYGGEMKQVVVSADVLLPDGSVKTWTAQQLQLSYRHSRMMEEEAIVLKAEFELAFGSPEEIKRTMEDFRGRRQDKQPLEYPSAGSTFKRPEGHFAGKLIMDAGLAGYRVGGAAVSEKHCGFVINVEQATAQDVYRLMQDVSAKVQEQFGVKLEPEVRLLGEF
ncbi:MAG: UDP-N-acetylmuramate dehydrogenase [Lachnospiraceae bacterium]|nr:UDP-N-acetylmuramate dehydrogenase [Lachnospiraceae bacterium]